jgi:Ser/Thr protein kinase RdoA (MazF antagonist)
VSEPEVPLLGGNVTGGLVRVGDTVRRPAGPWSAAVHHLLLHLEAVGFRGAPRSYGFDERGRHVLEFVPGEVRPARSPADSDAGLRRVGRLLRDLHDASAGCTPLPDAQWNTVIAPDREDLVVHHDAAPWNLVVGPERWVLIDWDTAAPGSRLWDLAYAAHGFVPLAPSVPAGVAGRRLRALVEGYGLDEPDRRELVDLLHRRVLSMVDLLRDGARDRVEPWATLWAGGHGEVWQQHADHVAQHEQALRTALVERG